MAERQLMPFHLGMLVSIPPKWGFAQAVGVIMGMRAIQILRNHGRCKRDMRRQRSWARIYFVSTVGREDAAMQEHVKKQEQEAWMLDFHNQVIPLVSDFNDLPINPESTLVAVRVRIRR